MDQLFKFLTGFYNYLANLEKQNVPLQAKSIIDDKKEINNDVWLLAMYYKKNEMYVVMEGVIEGRRVFYISPAMELTHDGLLYPRWSRTQFTFALKTITSDELKFITSGYTFSTLLITERHLQEFYDNNNNRSIDNWLKPIISDLVFAQSPFIKQFELFNKIVDKTLSFCAIFPIVGTIPALIKSLLGALELAISLGFLILSLPLLPFDFGKTMAGESTRHLVRGFDNFVIGLVLSLPVLGPLLFHLILEDNNRNEPNHKSPIERLSEFKLFPCTELYNREPDVILDDLKSLTPSNQFQ